MSPELFDPEIKDHRPTKCSDCYALGMVIYEVLSGHLPFYGFANRVIYGKVFRGDRPEKPEGAEGAWFTDEVWEVLRSCWAPQPENRPSIGDVLQCLEKVSRSWVPPSPRLLVALPTLNSVTWGSSNIVTAESTDVDDGSPSSQLMEKPDEGESAGTASQVSSTSSGSDTVIYWSPFYYLGKHFHATERLPILGPMRDAADRTGTEQDDLRSANGRENIFSEPAVQPSGDSTEGDNDRPAMDCAGSESDVVADDTPPVSPSPCFLVFQSDSRTFLRLFGLLILRTPILHPH